MKLRELKKLIDRATEVAGKCDPNVDVLMGHEEFEIIKVGQFSVVPDVVIIIKPVGR
jgi:hypothetical protein